MSVLVSETFADICLTLWGPDWKAVAAKRLRKSRRQLLNIELGRSKVSRKLRDELAQVLDEQIALLAAYRKEI